MSNTRTLILGGGSLGCALAEGLLEAGTHLPQDLVVTRRRPELLEHLKLRGVEISSDNRAAVRTARCVVIAVEPSQIRPVLAEIAPDLDPAQHVLVSCVTGVGLDTLHRLIGANVPIVLAMPNTALAVGASMTCLATRGAPEPVLEEVAALFETVGVVEHIPEDLMSAATVLGACGIAYALRFVRAASQGGIEIGFDSQTARRIAAQTAYGAAKLLLDHSAHPEREIDRVTTPRGCTIAGLNEMEHRGFSSALIKGVTTSFEKIASIGEDARGPAPATRPTQ